MLLCYCNCYKDAKKVLVDSKNSMMEKYIILSFIRDKSVLELSTACNIERKERNISHSRVNLDQCFQFMLPEISECQFFVYRNSNCVNYSNQSKLFRAHTNLMPDVKSVYLWTKNFLMCFGLVHWILDFFFLHKLHKIMIIWQSHVKIETSRTFHKSW